MTRALSAILVLAAASCAALVRAGPADIAATSRGVVRVVIINETDGQPQLESYGSGIAVGPDLILTNAHVVAPNEEGETIRIGVVPPQGKTGWFARVVTKSDRNDLALLKLTEHGSLPPATLFAGAVADGATVFAVGYPGNVDLAEGRNVVDLVSPTTPVKTQGTVSAGRSSKQYDTILHTAAIAAGNSGGPLLDACGRVIGINSFGTDSSSGADSSFYFAISMREISRFLTQAGVKPQVSDVPCRSIEDLDRAEADRLAREQALTQSAAQAEAQKQSAAQMRAREQAEYAVLSSREDHLVVTGVLLLLALAAGGTGVFLRQQGRERDARLAWITAALLVAGAIAAFATRPSFNQIDALTDKLTASASPSSSASTPMADAAGNYICLLDTERSRVTVSPVNDVPLSWSSQGCVNNRTQYGLDLSGWSRILVPSQEDAVTVASFDPETKTYKTERFLLDADTMKQLRSARSTLSPPACGGDEAAIRAFGDAQAKLKPLLPGEPNERMVYHCQSAMPAGH